MDPENEMNDQLKRRPQLEELGKQYEQQPFIRALIQLIPYGIGSAMDTALITVLNNVREERARAFFDELAKGNIVLTQERIANEDFLHSYFATARAALNTRRREKIKLFGRLFINYCKGAGVADTDTYEETLAVLDDLTLRELQVLLLLRDFESKNPILPGESTLQRVNRFWASFIQRVVDECGISKTEVSGYLGRLTVQGFIKQ